MIPIRIDSQFLSVVVHDLRNPLNVIGLSLRMIEEELPATGCDEARDDLRIVRENVNQIASMLTHLGDFARLVDPPADPPPAGIVDPLRLVREAIEESGLPVGDMPGSIQIEVAPGSPPAVKVDPIRARLALRYALANAVAAAGPTPVRVRLDGHEDRLRVEIAVDRVPRSSVRTADLNAGRFERLVGNDSERIGLDLALVARVSDLLGGTARLEVCEGAGSSIILDWPTRA